MTNGSLSESACHGMMKTWCFPIQSQKVLLIPSGEKVKRVLFGFIQQKRNWERGGRITPNEDDLDLEYWWQVGEDGQSVPAPRIAVDLSGTSFEDTGRKRSWILAEGKWTQRAHKGDAIAVISKDGKSCFAMAWPNSQAIIAEKNGLTGLELEPRTFPPKRRYHLRGKIYLMQGDLESLKQRIIRETAVNQ